MDNDTTNRFHVTTIIDDERWTKSVPDAVELAEKIKNLVLCRVAAENPWLETATSFTVNLCLSNDEAVHGLNKQFRGIDKPTNVLSFANIDDEGFESQLLNESIVELGDVIVAYETMFNEAEAIGVPLSEHFCHLWAHGLLHLLGYDHNDEDEAAEMEQREKDILERAGIANPYQEEL